MIASGLARHSRRVLVALAFAAASAVAGTSIDAQRAPARTGRFGVLTPSDAEGFAEAARRRTNYLPGQVLVKFKRGSANPSRDRALARLRSRPTTASLEWVGDVGVVRDASEPDAERLARLLSAEPEVEYAQPNYIRQVAGWTEGQWRPVALGPFDPTRQPFDPDYVALQWNFALIKMPGAWTINPGATSAVTVAVVDTGLTVGNETITAPIWTGSAFQTRSFVFAKSPDLSQSKFVGAEDLVFFDTGAPVLDFVGHGTHVASTIAEDANTQALVGIAYNARIMPLKACFGYWEIMLAQAERGIPGFIPAGSGGCSDLAVADALHIAADAGARVINMSLSGTPPSPVVRDALLYAVQRGAFISISAGNESEKGNPVVYPAAYGKEIDGVMTVGAVGKTENRAYYSNTGQVEIAAPGGDNRISGGDDVRFVWQVTLFPFDQDPTLVSTPRFDRYAEVGYLGTSMAAPHVAGVAALLMSQGDLRNPRAVEAFLKATAKDAGPAGVDSDFGAGILQAKSSLYGLGIRK